MGRTNEALWERAKAEAKSKMGGKHSARAMQLAGKIYKEKRWGLHRRENKSPEEHVQMDQRGLGN